MTGPRAWDSIRRVGTRLVFAALAATFALGCDTSTDFPPAPFDVRTVDLGNGYLALYTASGRFEIVKDNVFLLESPPFGSLFAYEQDPAGTGVFHNPTDISGATWLPVDASQIEMSSPAPGELHLVLPDQGSDTTRVTFTLGRDDSFITGTGERFGHVSADGASTPLFLIPNASEGSTNEAHVPVPFIVSTAGYGVFLASREAGAFDVGLDDPTVTRATFEGSSLDVTIFVDSDPLKIVAAYSQKTGLPRMPPEWAFSPMDWRDGWNNAAELEGDMAEIRKRHIPTSTIWIDNPWQTAYNTSKLNPAIFGDDPEMMSKIAAEGFRVVGWNTPYLEWPKGKPKNEAQQLFEYAKPRGYFVSQVGGGVWPALGCCVPSVGMIDFTYPDAQRFWEGILANATNAGFAGFKLDYGEDLVPAAIGDARLETVRHDGETERTGRTYPLGYHATYHAALDAARSDGWLIGRASAYGGQSLVDCIWPGDMDSDFSQHEDGGKVGGLPAVVIAAQTLAASGFPNFGSDTGGYKNGPPTREAELRWAEHTAFTMVMQNGGGGDSHNPWMYDEEAASIYKVLATQHNMLVPYLEGLAKQASTDGTPTIRALPLAYPDDQPARDFADDEYMLGPDILVAPIVVEGATSRQVHFPQGDWVHWFTGQRVHGSVEETLDAPLGTPLVFARDGAVIPEIPGDIDTVVEATAPGVISLKSHPERVEARAFVHGDAKAVFPNGSTVEVLDRDDGVTIAWRPVAPIADVVVRADLGGAKIGPAALRVLGADTEEPSRGCPSKCWARAGEGVVKLSLSGASRVTISR